MAVSSRSTLFRTGILPDRANLSSADLCCAVFAALVLLAMPVSAMSQVRDPRASSLQGQCGISGRVSQSRDGAAAPAAVVVATHADSRRVVSVSAESDGQYRIAGILCGKYSVRATMPGFVPGYFGQKTLDDPHQTLELKGDRFATADLKVFTGGVITGTILSRAGSPLPGIDVVLRQVRFIGSARTTSPVDRPVRSDDQGQFKFFGLPPGKYIVMAVATSEPSVQRASTGYLTTYYPGVTIAKDAQIVELKTGATETLSLPVAHGNRLSVSGVVTTENGERQSGGIISIAAGQGAPARAISIRKDGSFEFSGLSPGDYLLTVAPAASREPGEPRGAPTTWTQPMARIQLVDSSLSDVTVAPAKMATVTGRVLLTPPARNPLAQGILMGFRQTTDGDLGGFASSDQIRDDKFVLSIRPGTGSFSISTGTLTPSLWIQSITIDGIDVTNVPFVARPGAQHQAVVELTDRPTITTGRVAFDSGTVQSCKVLFFPKDEARWFNPRAFALARCDDHGEFDVRGLPKGEYFVAAVSTADEGSWTDPALLRQLRAQATLIKLSSGEMIAVPALRAIAVK